MSIDCCKSYIGKQVIGVLPSGGAPAPTTCLYYSGPYADSTGPSCFSDPSWDFNGQGIDFAAAAAVYGGYAVNDGDGTYLPYGGDTCSKVNFFYVGTSQPADVQVNDPIFGATQISLGATACSNGCLTTNSQKLKWTYYGMNINGIIDVPFTSYGTTSIDFVNDLVGATSLIQGIIDRYFPGSSVFITDDGGNNYTITFNDIWYNPVFLNIVFYDSNGAILDTYPLIEC